MPQNGEDPRLEDIAARPFQQTGVAPFAQDGLVDLPRTLFLHHVGFHQLTVNPHAKARDRSILRQGKVEDALQCALRVVDKGLLDDGAGNLIADVDGDLVVAQRQRQIAAFNRGDQGPHGFGRHGPLEGLQPVGFALKLLSLPVLDAEHGGLRRFALPVVR